MFQNIISQSQNKFGSEHLRKNKQNVRAGKKTLEKKQTNSFEIMQRLS